MYAWSVYIVRCRDGSLYTGIARDVAARIRRHEAGKGARYTRGRGPLSLLAVFGCRTKGQALRLEMAIKALRRADKELIVGRHEGPPSRVSAAKRSRRAERTRTLVAHPAAPMD